MKINRLHVLAGLVAALAALPAATAFSAQLYKWVDERGVVNYSNQPPADPQAAAKVATVEDRLSVYTPDPSLVRDIEAERQRMSRAASEKPEPRQPAVALLGAPPAVAPPAYESYPVAYPYEVFYGGFRPHRQRRVPQIQLPPGAIAGAMLGTDLLIPGATTPIPGIRTRAVQPRHGPRNSRLPEELPLR
jgi:hypothetical protein